MNDYRSTVNLPGQPLGTVAAWPDSPLAAVLVGQGVLVPVQRTLTEPLPPVDGPCGTCAGIVDQLPADGYGCPECGATRPPAPEPPPVPAAKPERPSAARKPKPAGKAPSEAPVPADGD